eukprot:jgi/Hompol1/3194/HPOL_006399-RA
MDLASTNSPLVALAGSSKLLLKLEFLGATASAKDRKASHALHQIFAQSAPPKTLVVGCTGHFARTLADAHPSAPESYLSTARKIAEHSRESTLVEEAFTRVIYDQILNETIQQIRHSAHSEQLPVLAVACPVENAADLESFSESVHTVFPNATAIAVVVGAVDATMLATSKRLANTVLETVPLKDAQISARSIMRSGILGGLAAGATMLAAKKYEPQAGSVVCILTDSAHSFADTLLNPDWLLENGIFDPLQVEEANRKFRGASVEDLQLPEAVCIYATSSCSQAMETMIARDFSQLPVINPKRKIVGLVSLAKLTAEMNSGNLSNLDEPISKH